MKPGRNGNLSLAENFYIRRDLGSYESELQVPALNRTCLQYNKFWSLAVPIKAGSTVQSNYERYFCRHQATKKDRKNVDEIV